MLTNTRVLEDLVSQFGPQNIFNTSQPYDMLTFETTRESIIPVLEYLNLHDTFRYRFLTDLCGIHMPDNKGAELGVVYHLHSFENNHRIRLKVFFPIADPIIPTAQFLYSSANWQERETFDFYGIIFGGHPNLKRILNVDDMDYHPMRKEYPLEDATRRDKVDSFFGR